MKLFIGGLSFSTSEGSLRAYFEEFGPLLSVKIATDRDTGRSRGFGFIEFQDASKAKEAIASRNGTMLDGREIVVNEARPKEGGSGPRGGGGYRGGNGGGGGYGGGGRSEGGRGGSRGGYSGGGGRW